MTVYLSSNYKRYTEHMTNPPDAFPMRLNKYLAHKGIATRKDADELIERGRVLVNNKKATLGMKVQETDHVEVLRSKGAPKKLHYFAFNKPKEVITHSPGRGEGDIISLLPPELCTVNLFPLGRLDKESHGLILLTNDGRVTERLLSPDAEHEKEYIVRTKLPLRASFKAHMEAGVDIEGYTTKPARVRLLGEKLFSIVITEGKKHQIRRMVVAMHNEVVDLKRTRIMHIQLGNLAAGAYRPLTPLELEGFLAELGLTDPPTTARTT